MTDITVMQDFAYRLASLHAENADAAAWLETEYGKPTSADGSWIILEEYYDDFARNAARDGLTITATSETRGGKT